MTLKRIYEHTFFPYLIFVTYTLLFGVLVYYIDYYSKTEISHLLKVSVAWFFRVNFLIILICVLLCVPRIRDAFNPFINRKGVFLAILLLFGFILVFFVAPQTHRIFYDEDIYANIGQTIARVSKTGYSSFGTFEYDEYYPQWIRYNKQPNGWPFLISIAFQVLGTNEYYAFYLNNLFFCGNLLLAFFITYHLTGKYFAGFTAALGFAMIPNNLAWNNTATVEPSAAFFAGLIVLSLIVYFKTRENLHLFLIAAILPFACQLRSESLLIIPWTLLAFLVLQPRLIGEKKSWAFGVLTTLFLIPFLLHLYAMGGHSWGATGAKFSIEYFLNNLSMNGPYYLNNHKFPALLTLFALVGMFSKRCHLKWRGLILLWFLIFWGVFLFFYAGGYQYGADVRYALVSFLPLAVLFGIGSEYIRSRIQILIPVVQDKASYIVLIVLLFSFSHFLPLARQVGQEAWGARHDHKYAKAFIKHIPERSIILTQNPTMFQLWKRNAIQTYAGINNPDLIGHLMEKYQGHVYFHHNYWCNTQSERNKRLCAAIREKYRLTEVVKTYEQGHEYALYRMYIR